jgi:hypothetical protein
MIEYEDKVKNAQKHLRLSYITIAVNFLEVYVPVIIVAILREVYKQRANVIY